MPTYEHSLNLLNLCKKQNNDYLKMIKGKFEKGTIHYNREYKNSGEEVYRKIITIWTSKLFLLKECIVNKYFNNNYIAWHDFNIINNKYYSIIPNKILLTNNNMHYYGKDIKYNCRYMFGNNNNMMNLIDKYSDELYNLNEDYCHDEETIIHRVYMKYPYLFD